MSMLTTPGGVCAGTFSQGWQGLRQCVWTEQDSKEHSSAWKSDELINYDSLGAGPRHHQNLQVSLGESSVQPG
jgi:hypothetical protein